MNANKEAIIDNKNINSNKFAWLYAIVSIFGYFALFFKDIAVAYVYGANGISDAYFYAYQIPFIFFIVLGGISGPFHKTTITVFSDMMGRPKEEIKNLLNAFLTLSGIFFLVLSVITFIGAGPIINLLIPYSGEQLQELTAAQLQIISPVIFIGGIIGILSGISNTYGRFFATSSGSAVAGVVFISLILIFGDPESGRNLAFAFLFSVIAQFVYQSFAFVLSGFFYIPEFNFTHKRFSSIKRFLFPAAFTMIIGYLYIFIDMHFVSELNFGSWSVYYYANSIFLFLTGIIAMFLLAPLFPAFEDTSGNNYLLTLRNYFYKALDSTFYIAFPVTVFIIIFAHDIVKLVYERGQFHYYVTPVAAKILFILSIAILPFVFKGVIFRIYSTINSLKAPIFVALSALLLKGGLNFILIKMIHMNISAIAISTVVVTAVEAFILAKFVKNKIEINYQSLTYLILQIVQATFLTFLFVLGAKFYLERIYPDTAMFLALKLLICASVTFITYFIFGLALKLDAAQELLANIKIMFKFNKVFNFVNHDVENAKLLINNPQKDYERLYKEMQQEKDKSDTLITNILPDEVASELKNTGHVKPVHYENASVVFTDFEGFTRVSKILSADELVKELDGFFKFFDLICEKYNLEKIKTIGDSYMCVGGVPTKNKTHAIDCILAAFNFLVYTEKVKIRKKQQNLPFFNVRIGINSGDVVAGVIGTTKAAYDLWGDTVNLASRMESSGEIRRINISETTYEQVKDFFDCTYRGKIEAKNAGNVSMYFVDRIKPELTDPKSKLTPNEKFYELYNKLK